MPNFNELKVQQAEAAQVKAALPEQKAETVASPYPQGEVKPALPPVHYQTHDQLSVRFEGEVGAENSKDNPRVIHRALPPGL